MATMDSCVFALMEISKQKPPISAKTITPCIMSSEEWFTNNKDCVIELKFELNPQIQEKIFEAKQKISEKIENLYLELKSFDTYGKTAIKETKTHPDTFMQVAIQVAGYRTKGRYVYYDLK